VKISMVIGSIGSGAFCIDAAQWHSADGPSAGTRVA
jgi:hypothetical protein